MRRLVLGRPLNADDTDWVFQALKKIERASIEDIHSAFDDLTVSGNFTETRTLNTGTATLSDLVSFVATLVTDIQKRGQNRNTDEVV